MLKISLNCFVRTCACVKSTIKFAYKVFEIYVLVKKYDSNTMSFIIKDREVNIRIETHQPLHQYQLSTKHYWKLLLQSIMFIILLFIAESLDFLFLKSGYYYLLSLAFLVGIFGLMNAFNLHVFNFNKLTKRHLVYVVIGVIISIVCDYIAMFFISTTANQEELDAYLSGVPLLLQLLSIGIVGPIIEECIFRAFIIKGIFRRIPIVGGIVSVIAFAAVHGPSNVIEWIVYGISGIILVVAFLKTQRLEVPILIHICINVEATIVSFL